MKVRINQIYMCVFSFAGRYTDIEKANRILLERMTTIMSHSSNRTTLAATPQNIPPVMQKRSLNSDVRRKELMKITIEN